MTARLAGNPPPDSAEWHALRRGSIGGSDIGSIVGVGYQTRDQLLAEKRAQLADDWTPDPPTPSMLRGVWLEPAVIAYLSHRGHATDPQLHGTWVHDTQPWHYNPDGIDTDGVLLEAKSTHTRRPDLWGRGGTDQIPAGYLCQVTWGCGLLGLDRWALGVIATKQTVNGSDFDFAYYRGRFDPDLYRALCAAADTFTHELNQETP